MNDNANFCAMLLQDTTAISGEYPVLKRYLGELRFAACLRDALALRLDQSATWKRAADALPERLSQLSHMAPEIAELAMLERAMRQAFEAIDPAPTKNTALHPSVSLLTFQHNTSSLWSALMCSEPPPRPYRLEHAQHVLAWRHKGQSRMRLLGEEEYLCILSLTPRSKSQAVKTEAATPFYVEGWLASDVVLAATSGPAEK